MINVWRIVKRRHLRGAFSGEGARLAGGRWNFAGVPLVYTSATLSLAVLELLVHTDPEDLPADLMAVPASLPVKVRRQEVTPSDLPRTWRQYPAPLATQTLGTDWANARKSTVLVVPSAIVPQERNYVLNPAHPDFRRLEVGKAEPFTLDTRLY